MAQGILEINGFLNNYVQAVNKDVDAAAKDAANEAKNYLRSMSPASTGAYAKDWDVKKQNASYVVYNKKHYQLTHLLEKGHDVVAYGKKVGHVKAQPHIAEAEKIATEQFQKELEEKISNEH